MTKPRLTKQPPLCHTLWDFRVQREKLELTQVAMAKKVGVSTNAIANWENGETHPGQKFLLAIAREYKIPIRWLIDQACDWRKDASNRGFQRFLKERGLFERSDADLRRRDTRRDTREQTSLNDDLPSREWVDRSHWILLAPYD